MADVVIEVPARSAYVGVVRLALTSLCRVVDLDEEKLEDLKTAVSEVCSNAVLARSDEAGAAPVLITWTEEPERVLVDVVDPATVHDETHADPIDSQGFSSRQMMSLALIQTLVSECEIGPGPEGGTRARLVVTR